MASSITVRKAVIKSAASKHQMMLGIYFCMFIVQVTLQNSANSQLCNNFTRCDFPTLYIHIQSIYVYNILYIA